MARGSIPAGASAGARRRMDPAVRRRVMASIRKRDTRPERALRAALRAAGLRGYRVNLQGLPGTPDVAFTRWRVAVFVDGVFWHGHPDHLPAPSLGSYWQAKIARNVERDREVTRRLEEDGWLVLRLWDLEVLDRPQEAAQAVARALATRGRAP